MNINIFEHQLFGRIVKINDEHGDAWLLAKDVCRILEYKNLRDAISRYVYNDDKCQFAMKTAGGMQNMTFINIQGVYDLCLHSRMPKAREFQKWITHEVLVDIRNYGMYIADNPPVEEYDENGLPIVVEWVPSKMREMVNKYFVENLQLRKENEALKAENLELDKKASRKAQDFIREFYDFEADDYWNELEDRQG